MKFNNYQCFSNINSIKTSLLKDPSKAEPSYFNQFPSPYFLKYFCKTVHNRAKRLDMNGCVIYEKIRRHLQDTDIPALLIFLKKNQDITHINLANNNISDSGFINLLDHVLLYKNIEELDLQNNNITKKGTNYLLTVGEYVGIKNLNLKANKFGTEASKNVALFLLKNKHINSLNVAEVDQTASSLIYFIMVLSSDQKVSNRTLKNIDISRPKPGCMYYFDSAHFADVIGYMLKCNTYLRALHLQKYNFNCHDIENMMSNAKYNNTLYLLDLGSNNIGDHGVEFITNWLVKRPVLKTLILRRNIITNHGARSLSFILPFSRILVLDISYNKITNDGMIDILNTLKKSPLLQQLKIFGNCISHPTAKIIKRMLTFGILEQEKIDVRPYRVDHKWYFAKYEGHNYKKEYYDVPYGLFFKAPKTPAKKTRYNTKYYKYIFSKVTELKLHYSTITIISKILSREHIKDCKCCYCLKCEAPHFDELCRDTNHPNNCNCCKCKKDSDISIDKSVTDRIISVLDVTKCISFILDRVNSEIQDKIIGWININEDILEKDLKTIAEIFAGNFFKKFTVTISKYIFIYSNVVAVTSSLQYYTNFL
ncbi:ribonuclease inhibitor isoform X2 [Megachile rotundata]|uniref:ribonuclease inhibitor isoform X2 n=1 Tax=Megachile rotundata TaxID=143995 RepID=UPI003FD1D837